MDFKLVTNSQTFYCDDDDGGRFDFVRRTTAKDVVQEPSSTQDIWIHTSDDPVDTSAAPVEVSFVCYFVCAQRRPPLPKLARLCLFLPTARDAPPATTKTTT